MSTTELVVTGAVLAAALIVLSFLAGNQVGKSDGEKKGGEIATHYVHREIANAHCNFFGLLGYIRVAVAGVYGHQIPQRTDLDDVVAIRTSPHQLGHSTTLRGSSFGISYEYDLRKGECLVWFTNPTFDSERVGMVMIDLTISRDDWVQGSQALEEMKKLAAYRKSYIEGVEREELQQGTSS